MQRTIYREQIDAFTRTWPCHGISEHVRQVAATFADNGDLVDLYVYADEPERYCEPEDYDGPAFAALIDDAQNFALEPCLDYRALRHAYALGAGGDEWSECMSWRFAIAGELYERGEDIPGEWQYRPSPMGGRDPDQHEMDYCANATTEALQRFGALLHRYAARLRPVGKDY